jgi:hypothetical protein
VLFTPRKLATYVALLALAGAGAWLLGAREQTEAELAARTSGGRLLAAAADWKRSATLRGCPTVSQLRVDRQLDRDVQTQDPWGQRFRILCTEAGVQVLSAGADRQFQTGDDIRLENAPQS